MFWSTVVVLGAAAFYFWFLAPPANRPDTTPPPATQATGCDRLVARARTPRHRMAPGSPNRHRGHLEATLAYDVAMLTYDPMHHAVTTPGDCRADQGEHAAAQSLTELAADEP